jgi:hypothetical protein
MRPRLLANENVPLPSVTLLRDAGFDVLAIAETSPGLSDRAVLDLAEEGLAYYRQVGEAAIAA